MSDAPKPPPFEDVVAFHGHRCLDIAMGYRVARAALERLKIPPQRLVATVGNDTCAVDAIQAVTGCTFGKRNLVPRLTGKPAYVWQDADTGDGVRVYVHYWESFDPDGAFRTRMGDWKRGTLSPADAAAFEAEHEALIARILAAPKAELFRLEPLHAAPPERSGGFASLPCAACGEHVKKSMLRDGRCRECGSG